MGELVPVALGALGQAGTLAVACIYLTEVPPLDHDAHLFRERTLTSVTSNTRDDGDELFALAGRVDLRPEVTRYELARTDRALDDLARGRITGAAVVVMP